MSALPATTSLESLRKPVETALALPGFSDSNSFALLQRMANALSQSSLVPTVYQGNLSNCMIALELAQRIGASPLMVAQNLYIVHGKPAWSSQFLIAAINSCGRYTSLQYEWTGEANKDSWTCRAFATDKATGARVQGPAVSLKMAKDQGWYSRKDSKWPSMTELMMVYRAATYFARTNAPELTMGIRTAEEAADVIDVEQVAPGQFEATTQSLREPAGDAPTGKKPRAAAKPAEPIAAEPVDKTTGEILGGGTPAGTGGGDNGAEAGAGAAGGGAPAPPINLEAALGYVKNAPNRDVASEAVDLARGLPPDEYRQVCAAYNSQWAQVV